MRRWYARDSATAGRTRSAGYGSGYDPLGGRTYGTSPVRDRRRRFCVRARCRKCGSVGLVASVRLFRGSTGRVSHTSATRKSRPSTGAASASPKGTEMQPTLRAQGRSPTRWRFMRQIRWCGAHPRVSFRTPLAGAGEVSRWIARGGASPAEPRWRSRPASGSQGGR